MTSTSDAPHIASPYERQALEPGEIRLLTIIWTALDKFELRTECHALTEELEYDAISYVWGTEPASVTVKCNDAALLVTPTAFEMLEYLYLSKPEPTQPIWIDAICINQADDAEKAVQVPQMYRIYSHANSVIVWGGRSTLETTVCMKGLNQLLSTDWFKRLWTFQEIVLAKEAILLRGGLWASFNQLLDLAVKRYYDWENHFGPTGYLDFVTIHQCRTIQLHRQKDQYNTSDLPYLLQYMRRRQVGEEVDRIWALYGLFDQGLRRELAPLVNYSETARIQHWFTTISCMKTVAQISQWPLLLDIPFSENPRSSYLPSWCPDPRGRGKHVFCLYGRWNRRIQKFPLWYQSIFTEKEELVTISRYDAIDEYPKRLIVTAPELDFLAIRGFEVDTVLEVIEDERLVGTWGYTEDYTNDAENFSNSNPTHLIAMAWLAKSLDLARKTCERNSNCNVDDHSSIPREFVVAFCRDHRVNETAMTAVADMMEALTARYYDIFRLDSEVFSFSIFILRTVGHSFISTKGGRLGIVTPGCKPGDKICVFYGGEPLYIIRPHKSNSDSLPNATEKLWDFVGSAYVAHLMDQHRNDDGRQGPDQMFTLA
ncbi:hypothetical protein EJ07DRAFT_134899 [Lizonia empirigonia]|nr:hypothetical protein EJ07DRAFT_134899 [Lizonia empirigonia]